MSAPNLFAIDLGVGPTLIEASAGTGKTYTIAALVARYVTECDCTVDQLLVVTFTRAATEELAERIRQRLVQLLHAVDGVSDETADTFVDDWLLRIDGLGLDHQLVRARLARAVSEIDLLAVSTIHGFCNRSLRQLAFDGALRFDLELVEGSSEQQDQIVRDFALTVLEQAPRSLVAPLAARLSERWDRRTRTTEPPAVLRVISEALKDLEQPILPEPRELSGVWRAYEAERVAYVNARQALAAEWATNGEADLKTLRNAKALGISKAKLTPTRLALIEDYVSQTLAGGRMRLGQYDSLSKVESAAFQMLTSDGIAGAMNKGKVPPRIACSAAMDEFMEAFIALSTEQRDAILQFQANLAQTARDTLQALNEDRGVRTYDELLQGLREAVLRDESLKEAMRGQYAAVLIDESQDTSPVQYDVFREVFAGHKPLFLIGDPKQAIYQFRGADVFAYLEAKTTTKHSVPLSVNYRSDPSAIDFSNCLFRQRDAPFVLEQITFTEAEPRPDAKARLLRNGVPLPGGRLVHPEAESTATNFPEQRQLIVEWLAADIAERLSSAETIDDTPVQPSDFAVLVKSNAQGQLVQRALRAVGVPSAQSSSGNVWESDSFDDLLHVLRAVAEPARAALVTRALVTPLFEYNANRLGQLQQSDLDWDVEVQRFAGWRERWLAQGVMAVFLDILRTSDVAGRVLQREGGERRMTNLLHVVELVHGVSQSERLSPASTIAWMERQRVDTNASRAELRTETDREAVQILTVHKSKGLEFGIVYLPDLWGAPFEVKTPFRVHDHTQGNREVLVIGGEREAELQHQAVIESYAEQARLLYVGVTRAKHQTVLVGGPFKNAAKGVLAYLLHPEMTLPPDETAPQDDDLSAGLRQLASASGATLEDTSFEPARYTPPAPAAQAIDALIRSERYTAPWRLTSFSGLTRDAKKDGMLHEVDDDADAALLQEHKSMRISVELDLLPDLPGGTRTGLMVHEFFELVSFANEDREERHRTMGGIAKRYGFDLEQMPRVSAWIDRVLETDVGGYALRDLPRADRLDELEFMLPVADASRPFVIHSLADALTEHGRPFVAKHVAAQVRALRSAEFSGFLGGLIDLVYCRGGRWYVLDYKTNVLGSAGAYAAEQLDLAMLGGHYHLQSLL
ncbi:MAG: exodeoxyribonuclease V beta subunit, partial [Bradymonadia bacterium]